MKDVVFEQEKGSLSAQAHVIYSEKSVHKHQKQYIAYRINTGYNPYKLARFHGRKHTKASS
jgi:hypothetical protein